MRVQTSQAHKRAHARPQDHMPTFIEAMTSVVYHLFPLHRAKPSEPAELPLHACTASAMHSACGCSVQSVPYFVSETHSDMQYEGVLLLLRSLGQWCACARAFGLI